jgi:hypothetical protein
MLKPPGNAVDERRDFIATGHCKRAPGAKVILDVDHEQNVSIAGIDLGGHDGAGSRLARRRSVSSARQRKSSAIVTG